MANSHTPLPIPPHLQICWHISIDLTTKTCFQHLQSLHPPSQELLIILPSKEPALCS